MILVIMWIKKSIPNGFTMIEALIALFISLMVSFCAVIYLRTCVLFINYRPNHQDQFAILQLRQIAAVSKDREVKQRALYMIYEHEEIRIEFDRNRLVKRDGYEILMENIEYAEFFEEDEKIYLRYQKDKKTFSVQIT